MVLIPRVITSFDVPAEIFNSKGSFLLDSVAGEKMVGLLTQIGQLAEIAADVFGNVLRDATLVGQRVGSLGQRVAALESLTPGVQHHLANNPASSFYSNNKPVDFQHQERATEQIFAPEARPEPIIRLREQAAPPPQVHLLDSFAHASCLAKYSDPAFFYAQWIKAEEEKLAKAMEEQQARKAKKKKGKKKNVPQQMKQVEAVQTKVYSALGKEFEDQAKAAAAQQAQAQQQAVLAQQQELAGQEDEDDEQANLATANVPRMAMPHYDYHYGDLPQLQYGQHGAGVPPGPAASAAAAPAPPGAPGQEYYAQEQANYYGAPPAVPAATYDQPVAYNVPAVPPPVVAPGVMALPRPSTNIPMAAGYNVPEPPAAPEAPTAPDAPSFSGGPAEGAGGGARPSVGGGPTDFASQIAARAGGLKKVEASAAEPTGRSGLLHAIRGGVQLRKVADKDKNKVAGPAGAAAGQTGAGGGIAGMGSIRQILARRAAIEQEADEEEEEWS